MFYIQHPHIFIDMRHLSTAFRAKLLFVAVALFLWGVLLLPATYLTLYALFTAAWDWTFLVIVPGILFGIFVAWVSYGTVLVRFNSWLRDNGIKTFWQG